jgi:hypothetical protein
MDVFNIWYHTAETVPCFHNLEMMLEKCYSSFLKNYYSNVLMHRKITLKWKCNSVLSISYLAGVMLNFNVPT